MNKSGRFSLRLRIKSFSYAMKGFVALLCNEHNARIHLAALITAIVLGILLNINITEWISVAIVSGMVFLAELFNTAIEKLADVAEPEWNHKIRLLKDYSAAAVLVAAVVAIITGGLIFIPRFTGMF